MQKKKKIAILLKHRPVKNYLPTGKTHCISKFPADKLIIKKV